MDIADSGDTSLLRAWIAINALRDKRRFLEQHPALLEPYTDQRLTLLAHFVSGSGRETLNLNLKILREARRRLGQENSATQAIRAAFVDLFGGFALDIPDWLVEIEQRIAVWKQAPSHVGAPLAPLKDAVDRARSDSAVPPEAAAELWKELGDISRNDVSENLALPSDQAFNAYAQALRVFVIERYPFRYATIQRALGIAYFHYARGSRRSNLEAGIACCEEALRVFTYPDHAYDWAQTLTNLGALLTHRVEGNPQRNLERAITCYRDAQEHITRESYPHEWGLIQHNLSEIYADDRIAGDYQENLEAALRANTAALEVRTAGVARAMTLCNRGMIFLRRIAGTREENVEQAIRAVNDALTTFTLADYPRQYAAAQNTLGNAYRERRLGERQDNLQAAIVSFTNALKVYTLEEFPVEYRQAQLNLASLYFEEYTDGDSRRQHPDSVRVAYQRAHNALLAARQTQSELGWLESDEQGRARLYGYSQQTRYMYARDAWCLWQLGDLRGAVVALEAGRAQALAEAQAIAGALLEGVCQQHASSFVAAREQLWAARAEADQAWMRVARDEFLRARQRIRSHCQPEFLPSEPAYRDIATAAAPDQALVYIAEASRGGVAFIVSPAHDSQEPDERLPVAIPLPRLTPDMLLDWIVRLDGEEQVVGGFYPAVGNQGPALLANWLRRERTDAEGRALCSQRLSDIADRLPPNMMTLRQAVRRLVQAWRDEADLLSGGDQQQRKRADELRERLALAAEDALDRRLLDVDLRSFFQEAEVDYVLPRLSDVIMQPVRDGLEKMGLGAPHQAIALIACGRLGALPLHAAPVCMERMGSLVPFQETCELTYQASARSLAIARQTTRALDTRGPFFTVGNPRPTSTASLPWAEVEAEEIVTRALRAGRTQSVAILTIEASRKRVIELLRMAGQRHPGAWIDIAGHGFADVADPRNSYMLLAGDERLTLVDLQRERLLAGVRCFTASGCMTGLGDLEMAPDELGSFAAGALQAGAASAIATQWSVGDQATCYLMLRFAELVLGNPGITPAQALRQAGRWLRTANRQELSRITGKGIGSRWRDRSMQSDGDDPALCDELRGVAMMNEAPHEVSFHALDLPPARVLSNRAMERPFEHPIYWASAVVFGA